MRKGDALAPYVSPFLTEASLRGAACLIVGRWQTDGQIGPSPR
jgi:hypothetical protein